MQDNGNTLLTMIKRLVTTKFAQYYTVHNNVNMFCLFLYNLLTSIEMPETVNMEELKLLNKTFQSNFYA